MAYISMKDYTKNINKKIVLDHVNLNIEQGGINALVGSNGSGKTMLIRAISGLITADSGTAVVDGVRVGNGVFPKSLGLMIENITMLEYFSAFENLKMLNNISTNKVTIQEIRNWLDTFELDSNDKRPIKNTLSECGIK